MAGCWPRSVAGYGLTASRRRNPRPNSEIAVPHPALRGTADHLPDDRFELLRYACAWHTDGQHHDDPTIATCWDADRLDLGRVGITTEAVLMSTDFGREIAAHRSVADFILQSQTEAD